MGGSLAKILAQYRFRFDRVKLAHVEQSGLSSYYLTGIKLDPYCRSTFPIGWLLADPLIKCRRSRRRLPSVISDPHLELRPVFRIVFISISRNVTFDVQIEKRIKQ